MDLETILLIAQLAFMAFTIALAIAAGVMYNKAAKMYRRAQFEWDAASREHRRAIGAVRILPDDEQRRA